MRCQYWLKQQNMESLKEFRGDFRELLKLGKETIYSKINEKANPPAMLGRIE